MAWKCITLTDIPNVLQPFLLEWDNGGWVKATLLASGAVIIEWHLQEYSVWLDEIEGRMWLEIPKYKELR